MRASIDAWNRGDWDAAEVQARAAWVWTIRDGSVVRLCFYQERQDALEAVGLSGQDAQSRFESGGG